MPTLPVRTGADVHLAHAFEQPGCPLCRERDRMEAAYLESILAESVLDVAFRATLDQARGFCPRHCTAVLEADRRASGSLGSSILLRATLVARLRDLEALHRAGSMTRGRRATDAARPPACPACARVAHAQAVLAEGLVAMTQDAGWAEATAGAPFCLDHLVLLMGVRPVPAWWPPVEARQLQRLRKLRDRLEAYAHASSHDRKHLQTDDQRASVAEAADLLGEG
jgi:hypothetical protein